MTSTTFNEDGNIVHVDITEDTQHISGAKIRQLLDNDEYSELAKHVPGDVFNLLIKRYTEYKIKVTKLISSQQHNTQQETKNKKLAALREKLRKRCENTNV